MKNDFTPKSRKENLVVQELEGEVLIYDLEKNKAFCLNQTSALVWQSCDGSHTIAEISDAVGKQLNSQVNEDFVWLALDQLSKENLIENKTEVENKFTGMSRREAVRKVGLASLVALPVIASLSTPVYAQGTCVLGGTCTCTGTNTGAGNTCTPAAGSTCNPGCRCVFDNNGNNNGRCAVPA
jgi:hypothetical protein